ncbi:MAG: LON peptidase substrate-binding domain-containing protein [Acidobacteria bacterium]|nr:LON peptidase substrate-binding domain-containing protein [Acidobacteriota bacterium]
MILPVFPLGCTLLPGGRLPLHVFEDRYRSMVVDVLAADDPVFGVVLIERGSEVGGGEVRGAHGTVARVLQCRRFADGRYALVAGGTTRFEVESWADGLPYPAASVRLVPDSPVDECVDVVERLRGEVRSVNALAVECGSAGGDLELAPTGDAVRDLWHMIDSSPLGHYDRHDLLAVRAFDDRCRRFSELLADVRAVLLATISAGDGGRAGDAG